MEGNNNQRRFNNNQQRQNRENNQQRGGNNNRQQDKPRPKKIKNPDPMGNPVAMGRFAIKIIKDIAFGRCKIDEIYENFRNPIFIQSAINEVREKIANENIYVMALNTIYMQYGDPRAQHLLKKHNNSIYAWSLVDRILYQIQATGDPSPLFVLVNQLPQYKYCI